MSQQAVVGFSLERFAWREGALEVAGRWTGVEERRLGRPVLHVMVDGERRKLPRVRGAGSAPGDPRWAARFAWTGEPGEITAAELDVGRRLVVDLPPPRRRAPWATVPGETAPPAPEPEGSATVDEAVAPAPEPAGSATVGEAVASPAAPAAAEVEALAAREGRLAEEVDVLRQALADAAQEAEDHLQALADARERAERVADLEAERDALREEAASIPDLEAELDRLRAMLDAVRVPAAREDLAEDEDDDEDDLPAALRGHDEEITAQRTRPFTPLEIADAVEGPEDDAPPPRRPAGPRPAVPERGAWEDEIAALPGPSGSAFATSEHDAIDPEAGGGRDGGAGPAFLRAVRGATAVRPRREDGEADGTAPGGAVLTKLRELLAPPPVADGAATRRPARRATTDRSRAASPARDVAEARRAALAARRLATQSGRRPTGTGRAPATAEDSWAARGVAILVVVLLLVALLVIVSAIA